ncbi:hypothetical protein B0H13DRAFT_2023425, partial [Mycena leptocephala]
PPQRTPPPRSNHDLDSDSAHRTYPSESGSPGTYDGQGFYDQEGYDPYPPQDSDSESSGGQGHTSTHTYAEYPSGAGQIREAYPAWSAERQIPCLRKRSKMDSMRNMFDFLMQLLDSRASRMSPNQALLTLHADYIGGQQANYRKWYFAAQLDLDDAVGKTQNPGLNRLRSTRGPNRRLAHEKSLNTAMERWRQAMNNMSQYDRLRQIALYLLCWGEC